ncbi:hypothetical protein G6L37_00720 [Agrobacterium rubi]|nr:hypothetical protein [Agrobacterium rubi]NTF23913.1 hypothetical protein [Agrobacterium rubi]
MKRIQSMNVDMDALPETDLSVDAAIVERDLAAMQGSDWELPDARLNFDDPLVQSLVQWLGKDAVDKLRNDGFQALKRSIAMLPDPVDSSSFVWAAINGPSDIIKVSEAVMSYREFDEGALIIADAMGANVEFRNVIRSLDRPEDMPLKDFLALETIIVGNIHGFNERLGSLVPFMKALFGDKDFSVGSAVVAIAAVKGFMRGLSRLESGFALSQSVNDELLGRLEAFREDIVKSAEVVKRTCKVNPLRFSLGVLSGVRRSLLPDGAGDFRYAVRAIGGTIESDEDLKAAAIAFSEYLRNTDDFNVAMTSAGLSPEEAPQVVSHIMARRHLMTAAQTVGVPWFEVSGELSVLPDVRIEAVEELISHVADDGLTGRLKAVAKGYSKRVADVLEVGRHHVTTRRYWMDAAERVVDIDSEISIGDLKELVRIEPQIGKAKELLKSCGATSRQDIDKLEQHLEWMTYTYALPVDDAAFDAIISSRAEVIPLRLSQQ